MNFQVVRHPIIVVLTFHDEPFRSLIALDQLPSHQQPNLRENMYIIGLFNNFFFLE